jgi:hypothetical protein
MLPRRPVLVVDGGSALRARLLVELRTLHPIYASTAAEAVAALGAEAPRAVVVHAELPDGSGAELLATVRRLLPDCGRVLIAPPLAAAALAERLVYPVLPIPWPEGHLLALLAVPPETRLRSPDGARKSRTRMAARATPQEVTERDETFADLVEELEKLDNQRTLRGGFVPELAARKQHLERVLMDALSVQVTEDQRRKYRRVPCQLEVTVTQGDTRAPGVVRDVGMGGALIDTSLPLSEGQAIEIEVPRLPGVFDHGLKVRGSVAWAAGGAAGRPGIGVAFTPIDDGSERRLRRFILELLSRRVEVRW